MCRIIHTVCVNVLCTVCIYMCRIIHMYNISYVCMPYMHHIIHTVCVIFPMYAIHVVSPTHPPLLLKFDQVRNPNKLCWHPKGTFLKSKIVSGSQ